MFSVLCGIFTSALLLDVMTHNIQLTRVLKINFITRPSNLCENIQAMRRLVERYLVFGSHRDPPANGLTTNGQAVFLLTGVIEVLSRLLSYDFEL